MAAPTAGLRASFSEPLSLFTSFARTFGEVCNHRQSPRSAHDAFGQDYEGVKTAIQMQLENLATFAQSTVKEALALTERIGTLKLDLRQDASERSNTLRPPDRCTEGLAQRTDHFATLIFDMDRARLTGEETEDIIKRKNRQLWNMFDEKETLRLELEIANLKRDDKKDTEMEHANEKLTRENSQLRESKELLEEDLRKTRIEADAWKSLAENVQEMQEMAISAFERCNALERENIELKEAMHAFAEGSTSFTVKQLQKIISSLTEEVSVFKKREGVLKEKENIMRDKENNSIIKAMRKQTRDLKV
ncbi:hypothetical protein BDW22DRAFT_259493 [Trametopsis cervina]|nr:hypothetical protein BDW22DRAFT_259493 [Trametopsis cervina]